MKSEIQMGLTQFSAPVFIRPKSRCQQSCAFFFFFFFSGGSGENPFPGSFRMLANSFPSDHRSQVSISLLASGQKSFSVSEATHSSCLVVSSIFTPAGPCYITSISAAMTIRSLSTVAMLEMAVKPTNWCLLGSKILLS